VLMDRFRANIVLTCESAFVEDKFTKMQMDGTELRFQNRRKRCSVVNINQQKGTSSPEVLKTLASYRKKGNGVYFGISAVALSEVEITSSSSFNLG